MNDNAPYTVQVMYRYRHEAQLRLMTLPAQYNTLSAALSALKRVTLGLVDPYLNSVEVVDASVHRALDP